LFTRKDEATFQHSLNNTIRTILALTMPVGALLAVGIRPLIDILGFDSAGTELVVWTTRAYMAGLVGHSLLEVAARAFYAQQNALTPLLTSGLTALVFVILGLILAPLLGAPGIGLANTLAFTAEALLLLWLLARKHPQLLRMGKPLLRISLISFSVGLVAFLLLQLLPLDRVSSPVRVLTSGVVLGLAGLTALPFLWSEVKLIAKI
jgi:putative peptidoglycan lipid II flippase